MEHETVYLVPPSQLCDWPSVPQEYPFLFPRKPSTAQINNKLLKQINIVIIKFKWCLCSSSGKARAFLTVNAMKNLDTMHSTAIWKWCLKWQLREEATTNQPSVGLLGLFTIVNSMDSKDPRCLQKAFQGKKQQQQKKTPPNLAHSRGPLHSPEQGKPLRLVFLSNRLQATPAQQLW